ncbi:MAG: hypothetical protein QF519_04310 [Candidatus Poseidoniia archaeon]|nr:hypothetical protein [Candidatus Poseidoniia archaeon]
MKEPGRGEVAQLWLALLPQPLELNAAATATGLEPALVAKLATHPEAADFIAQATAGEELELRARLGWLLERLHGKMRLRKHEWNLLEQRLRHQLGPHVARHWTKEGTVVRDLEQRPAGEWVLNELSFTGGFALWFREHEEEGGADLSALASQAAGAPVEARGELVFDRSRLELLEGLPQRLLRALSNMSPAGKLAYRSLELAVMKGLAQGDRTREQRMRGAVRPWWKIWG